jgi:hypothetical protein
MVENDPKMLAFLVAGSLLCGAPLSLTVAQTTLQVAPEDGGLTKQDGDRSCRSAIAHCRITVGQATAPDTPVNIISHHIWRQGYSCDEPRHAEHDAQASRPDEAVWILRCDNITYRVTLIPDRAARVEIVK